MIIAIAPFCAFLASIFLLPEVFGHAVGDENDREHDASPAIAPRGMNPRPPNINRPGRRGGPR